MAKNLTFSILYGILRRPSFLRKREIPPLAERTGRETSMLRSLLLYAILVVASMTTPASSSAADCHDVVNVVGLLYADDARVLARKFYPEGGVQVVFIHCGLRYTLFHTGEWDSSELNWLSVWVRPDGTSGQEDITTFSDHGLDGSVDFGIAGGRATPELRGQFEREKGMGTEYCQQWQELYNQSIAAALAALKPAG